MIYKIQGFGLSGEYVAAGSSTWLDGSEFGSYITQARHSRK